MAFPPKRDHRITLADAVAMTKAHRAQAAEGATKAELWPREVFEAILAQPDCAGIRIYHGLGADAKTHLVLVAVDANGADMSSGTIMEFAFPCPPWCDTASPLQG